MTAPRKPESLPVIVGRRIRQLRNQNHVILEDLAAQISVDKTTVSRYERGEMAMSLEKLGLLARALGVTPAQLVADETPDPIAAEETP